MEAWKQELIFALARLVTV